MEAEAGRESVAERCQRWPRWPRWPRWAERPWCSAAAPHARDAKRGLRFEWGERGAVLEQEEVVDEGQWERRRGLGLVARAYLADATRIAVGEPLLVAAHVLFSATSRGSLAHGGAKRLNHTDELLEAALHRVNLVAERG